MTGHGPRDQYGTREWFDQEYGKDPEDPWGLSWRPSQRLRYQRVLAALQAIEEPVPRVMDVGCATGEFTHLIARHLSGAARVLGVDFVPAAVERARRRFPDVRFAAESIFALGPRYHGQFDLVVCLEVLYYIETQKRAAALRSLRETVRDDGYVALSSFIGPSPHFAPAEFLDLVATEFEIVRWELLHLRIISSIEKLGTRLDARMAGPGRIGRKIGSLPWSSVVVIERWSRHLGSLGMSHILVIARARKGRS